MENLDALNDALSKYDNALNEETARKESKENKVVAFLKEFKNVAETIIKPAFEEALNSIKERGHGGRASVGSFDETAYLREKEKITAVNATLLVFIKGVKKKRENEPHIFFNARSDAAETRQINVVYNMFTSGELENGGYLSIGTETQVNAGKYLLEDITPEVAKTEAVKFLTELFNRIKIVK